MVGEVFVDAQRALAAVGLQPEMLEHLLLLVLGEEVVAGFVAHRAAILAWLVVSFRWMVVPMRTGAPGL